MLVSTKHQHEFAQVPSTWTSPIPTPLGCYRAPLWIPWVIQWITQQIPIGYPFYVWQCMFPHYSLHTFHPPLPPSSVVSISLFSTGSRLIHLISTDSNASLLWLSNIPLYTRTTASLSIHLSMEIYIHQSSFCLFKLVDWVSFFSLTIKQSKNMTFHYSDSSDFFFFF